MKKLVLENGDTKKLLIFVGVILFLALGSINRIKHLTDPDAGTSDHKVIYVVSSGEGMHLNASLTYMNSSGGTQQENFYGAGPFEIEVHKVSGDFVYISAQLKNEYLDNIHVAILVDGKLLQEASSTGSYSIATASGRVQ